MNQGAANTVPSASLAVSTNNTITIGSSVTSSSCNPDVGGCLDTIYVYNERYRMVAALYTDSAKNILAFSQDGDTFYLKKPAADISNGTVGNADTTLTLGSVPNGIAVEWLGRCVGGSAKVIVYSPPQNPGGAPMAFPMVPGYDITTTSPQTAQKYRVWTDTGQHIHAWAGSASTPIDCMTDGWVLHRAQ